MRKRGTIEQQIQTLVCTQRANKHKEPHMYNIYMCGLHSGLIEGFRIRGEIYVKALTSERKKSWGENEDPTFGGISFSRIRG